MSVPLTTSGFRVEASTARQLIVDHGGAQVGKGAQFRAQFQEAGLGLEVVRHGFPFGAADGAEEQTVGGFDPGDGLIWQGDSGGINGGTAGEVFAGAKAVAEFAADGFEHAQGLGVDFRADAVAVDH